MTDPAFPVPTPPVHAARLSSLLKNLASAEGAVNDSMKARQELIAGLEKLLESNKRKLAEDQTASADLSRRRATTESKKKEVEDGIMRGLKGEVFNTPLPGNPACSATGSADDGSPEMEAFTPPPPELETFTPTASPRPQPNPEPSYPVDDNSYGQDFLESETFMADRVQEQQPTYNEPPPSFEPPPATQSNTASLSGVDALLKTLAAPPHPIQPSTSPAANGESMDPRLKRRKMSHKATDMDEEPFAGGDGVGIDSDVAAMLGAQ